MTNHPQESPEGEQLVYGNVCPVCDATLKLPAQPLTPEQVERVREIRARAEKATKGPWNFKHWTSPLGDTGDYGHVDQVEAGDQVITVIDEYFDGAPDPEIQSCLNGEFIANSKSDIEFLLSLLPEDRK